jgi:hypothetical protein
MRFTRIEAILLISTLQILIPAALILWTWKGSARSVSEWAVRTGLLIMYIVFISLAGSWVFASFYIRYLLWILSIVAIARSVFHLKALPFWLLGGTSFWIRGSVMSIALVVLVILVTGAVRSRYFQQQPVSLSFPFRHGVYAVFGGG